MYFIKCSPLFVVTKANTRSLGDYDNHKTDEVTAIFIFISAKNENWIEIDLRKRGSKPKSNNSEIGDQLDNELANSIGQQTSVHRLLFFVPLKVCVYVCVCTNCSFLIPYWIYIAYRMCVCVCVFLRNDNYQLSKSIGFIKSDLRKMRSFTSCRWKLKHTRTHTHA